MQAKAKAKYVRVSAKKARLVAGLVRGMDVSVAQDQLLSTPKFSSEKILSLLNSAVANAENNYELDKDNMFIKKIVVNEGPTLKRWMPVSRGQANEILKRTSHIEIVLDEKVKGKKSAKKGKGAKMKDAGKKSIIKKVKTKDDIGEVFDKESKGVSDRKKKSGFFQGAKKGEGGRGKSKGKKGFLSRFFRRKSEG